MNFDRLLLRGIRTRVPLFLLGSPGIGKTSLVTDFCRRMSMHLEVVIASLREPTDFAGLPVVSKDPIKVNGVDVKEDATKPPARYNEASLLGAMENAGKLVDDEALAEAMKERGLGTPATRADTVEGLINQKYMERAQRELVPTPRAIELRALVDETMR